MDPSQISQLGDVFGNLTNAANKLKGNLTALGLAMAAVAIVAAFIGLSLGSRMNQMSKSMLTWACIGVGGIGLAMAIISWIQTAVGGGF